MAETVRIFISSTWKDLQPEREAVEKALHRMQAAEFSGMEYFGSRPETPREASLAEVDRSDIYVGLFAHRYGSGITEDEYRRARQRGLPCLIYLKDEHVPVVPAHYEQDPAKVAKLAALKQGLSTAHIVSFFTSPDHLATQVVTDLHNFLSREKPSPAPSTVGSKYNISVDRAQGVVIGDGNTVSQVFGQAGTPPAQAGPVQSQASQRCADLAENIRETLSLLKLYEEQRRLAGDPREKRRAEREIADLREQLSASQAEARELGCE
jgi:hypothetical protein